MNPSDSSGVPSVPPPPPPLPEKPAVSPKPAPHPSHEFPMVWVTIGVIILAVAAIAVYLWPNNLQYFSAEKPEAKPFIIGGILPLSGDDASYGYPIQQTAILAANEINEAGGINGQKIEFVWRDGKCDGEVTSGVAGPLIDEYAPQVIIGGACSSEFLSVSPLAQLKKILTISPSASSPQISELGKYVFRSIPPDSISGRIAADFARDNLGASKAAILTEDQVYTQGLRAVFSEQFKERSGTIVADEVVPTGAGEFSSAVTKIKKSAPDVVYILPQSPSLGVLMVKELKKQGVTAQLLTAEVLLTRDAVREHAEVLEGVIGIELFVNIDSDKAQQLIGNFTREYGRPPTYPPDAVGMYDLMYLMKDAFEAGDGDPDKASEYLYNLKDWTGALGKLTFARNGDPSLPYHIQKVVKGDLESVAIVRP